ncbi:phage distal tail protein [Anaeroselena agilis]|uniref:Phage tail family protein n=1 Tax=Anaeroselena agilis TaxID=3063788 RepID=A0ABU3NY33_9FIRM|nr:phage tail family protein [Selenomonadales bacterium 4137-cl]
MSLVLDKNGNQYTLPTWLVLDGEPFSIRRDTVNKAFGHGSIMTADGKVTERELVLRTEEASELFATRAAYEAAVRALTTALMRGPQKLVVDGLYFYNIETLADFDNPFVNGWASKMSEFEIPLLATDPFKYALTETTVTEEITESPTTFTVTNAGLEVSPVITITAAATNSSMSLVNTSDGSRTMGYTDTLFTSGASVVFDGVEGTVKRGAVNTINNFGGSWLRLLAGANSLTYTGAACTISLAYRERWL